MNKLIGIKTARETRATTQNLGPMGEEIERLWNEIACKIQEAQMRSQMSVSGFSESADIAAVVGVRLQHLGYSVALAAEPVLNPLEQSHSDKPRVQLVRVTVDWSNP